MRKKIVEIIIDQNKIKVELEDKITFLMNTVERNQQEYKTELNLMRNKVLKMESQVRRWEKKVIETYDKGNYKKNHDSTVNTDKINVNSASASKVRKDQLKRLDGVVRSKNSFDDINHLDQSGEEEGELVDKIEEVDHDERFSVHKEETQSQSKIKESID